MYLNSHGKPCHLPLSPAHMGNGLANSFGILGLWVHVSVSTTYSLPGCLAPYSEGEGIKSGVSRTCSEGKEKVKFWWTQGSIDWWQLGLETTNLNNSGYGVSRRQLPASWFLPGWYRLFHKTLFFFIWETYNPILSWDMAIFKSVINADFDFSKDTASRIYHGCLLWNNHEIRYLRNLANCTS